MLPPSGDSGDAACLIVLPADIVAHLIHVDDGNARPLGARNATRSDHYTVNVDGRTATEVKVCETVASACSSPELPPAFRSPDARDVEMASLRPCNGLRKSSANTNLRRPIAIKDDEDDNDGLDSDSDDDRGSAAPRRRVLTPVTELSGDVMREAGITLSRAVDAKLDDAVVGNLSEIYWLVSRRWERREKRRRERRRVGPGGRFIFCSRWQPAAQTSFSYRLQTIIDGWSPTNRRNWRMRLVP